MLAQLLQYVDFLAASFLGKSRSPNDMISWSAIDRARRVARRAAETAIVSHLKQGPMITESTDGLRVFGQYGFIRYADGRLFALSFDEGHGFVANEQLSIADRDAVLFRYCRYALSSIAQTEAKGAWQRALRPYGGGPELAFPWMGDEVGFYLQQRRYMKPFQEAVATHLHVLFDHEVWELASQSCMGEPLTLADYNRVVVHVTEWRALKQQAEALLPLVGRAYRQGHIADPANLLGDTRNWLLGCGMTPAEWKLLCRLTPGKIRQLLAQWDAAGEMLGVNLIRFTRHWVEAGTTPTSDWVRRYLRTQRTGLIPPPWFDRAALDWTKDRDGEERTEFLRNSYANALDWLREYLETGRMPDANQRRLGWTWIQHQSDRWHREVLHRPSPTNKVWHSLVPAYNDGPYRVIPLTSTEMLMAEGRRMHHCVGRKYYVNLCASGMSRIFSIEKSGERVSTVQLVPYNDHWRVYMNNGIANCPPEAGAVAVGRRLAERYTQAAQKAANGVPAGKSALAPSGR
jgi:hypothetical protein